jgi:folate-dependent phosphoribosylglycinamide formyltransferase PurN
MKITVFTSNQPRHISLIESLATIADRVYAIQECNTVFPGKVEDFFRKSETMQEYFSHVIAAEEEVFGHVRFTSSNVTQLAIKMGDLNNLDLSVLEPALSSDYYIVFGASYIKGDLVNFLVENQAINIHMGVSPYYRGSSCNFWALYDGRPEMVGATIHLLSKGLDSGDILFHAFPPTEETDAFVLGMKAVKSAHDGLISYISSGKIKELTPVRQDRSKEIRYTRNRDFTDEVARNYLDNMPSKEYIYERLKSRDIEGLIHPFYGS